MVGKHAPDDFAEMLKRYDRAMNRLVNGDPEPIKALYSHSDETSQCGAWGGVDRGWAEVNARWDWVAAQFIPAENTLKQELVLTSVTAEMAYVVFFERGHVGWLTGPNYIRWTSGCRQCSGARRMDGKRCIVTAITSSRSNGSGGHLWLRRLARWIAYANSVGRGTTTPDAVPGWPGASS